MKTTLAIVLAAVVAGGLAGAIIGFVLNDNGPAASAAPSASLALARSGSSSAAETSEQIYKTDAPAVVVIADTQTQEIPATFFTPASKQKVRALGSGFVIDRRGDILTNDHVVQGATAIRVGFNGGASYPATVVGADPSTDLAVVRVHAPASVLHPLTFADSNRIQVGDQVFAIGNPFGLDGTMTAGIVSSIGRDILAPNGLSIPSAIQTDAPINHGNSGGPLLDRFGRVVGVNSQIEGGTVDANVGVGFAISSDTAKSVAGQLIASGHPEHAWLGVQAETIDPSAAKVVRDLPSHGVVVARVVKGSPAAKAGLKPATSQVTVNGVGVLVGGDAIVALNGKRVSSTTQLADALAQLEPGDKVTLELVRQGSRRSVEITLGNVPEQQ